MQLADLAKWWRGGLGRVPLAGGKITDYVASVARYNRALSARTWIANGLAGFTAPADGNRVAISAWCSIGNLAGAQSAVLQLQDANSNAVVIHTLVIKAADVALVTPSPFTYVPFYADALTIGPLINYKIVMATPTNTNAYVVELLANPELDFATGP